ncbi:MAG: hypothetical protein ACI8ZX_000616 [Planctomycetota bacterium]|jgi:hypothetical protein
MKKIKKLLILSILTSFAYNANAQITVTSEMGATATIVAPILITAETDMGFGKLSVTGAGSVVMSSGNGSFTNDGLAQAIDANGTPGQVSISGATGENYKFTVTQTTPLTTGTLGDNESKMQMTDFTVTVDGGGESSATGGVSTSLTGTSATIKIGAKLNTIANQVTGAYAGEIAVVFQYE